VCLAGHEAKRKDGLEIQINIDQNEKPKDKLAVDHFFSSLLGADVVSMAPFPCPAR
jgi:hypothetical protein